MINLEDYKPKGTKSAEATVIRTIDKIPPGMKPDINGYHYVKLVGLILGGARIKPRDMYHTPSVVPDTYITKNFRVSSNVPLLQLRLSYKGWLITYQSTLGNEPRRDGNIILKWMGCSDINDAIGLDWEGIMPLQYGDRNPSLIVPNIVQMRKDLYGPT